MKKGIIIVTTIVCIGFSYGVRPAFDVGVGWSYYKPEDYNGDHFLAIGIGTTVPYSRYIGVRASIFGISFDLSESGTILGISSCIGFIEMIPTKIASPYFTQSIVLVHVSGGGLSATDFGIGIGVGIEFISSSYVSPYLGSHFIYTTASIDGFSDSAIDIGAGLGVRFSWVN